MTSISKPSLVFVIGAGASYEFGLPLGSTLKKHISESLDIRFEYGHTMISGSSKIEQAFRLLAQNPPGLPGDINPLLEASWIIRDAMPQAISIDNFVEAHQDNNLISQAAKLAIALSILEAESKSYLKIDSSNIYNTLNFEELNNTWISKFFHLIVDGCQISNIKNRLKQIAIITFNYDRTIEFYLHEALRNYYKIDSQVASELITHIKIFHPYGYLGELAWPHRHPAIEYGGTINAHQLIEASKNIKTFTEGVDEDKSEINAIRNFLYEANKIVFLGFAYHEQNLKLLYPVPKSRLQKAITVFGTAKDISENNASVIRNELIELGGFDKNNLKINTNLTCSQLFEEYGRSLKLK
jgi:hypothetical protein